MPTVIYFLHRQLELKAQITGNNLNSQKHLVKMLNVEQKIATTEEKLSELLTPKDPNDHKNAVIGRFKRLRCMEFAPTDNRWMWLYKEEAKDIKFTTSYRDIPKEARPIILGSFTWDGDQELRLDVRSFERVIEAIQFFDQKINHKLATVTKLKVVNKLFPATTTADELSIHHHLFFEQRQAMGPKTTLKELEEIASQNEGKDEEERHTEFLSYLEEQMKKTLPEVEELATHFYEDGLQSLFCDEMIRP